MTAKNRSFIERLDYDIDLLTPSFRVETMELVSLGINNTEINSISPISWSEKYKQIINQLKSNLETHSFKNCLEKALSQSDLLDIRDITHYISSEMDQKIVFYSLINVLSKYPYIKKYKGVKSFSVSPQGFVNLSIIKDNESYQSILNLEFKSNGKVTFNAHDNDVDDYLIHGTFISPRMYLSNRKFKQLLNLLDD